MADVEPVDTIALGTADFLFRPDCHEDIPVDIAHAMDIAMVEALNNHGAQIEASIPTGDGRTLMAILVVE
jgi:hypothetical protein